MSNRKVKGSWLEDYLTYTRNQESPTIFHKWVGLSIIASAMERNVVLDMGAYKLFPNLYVILVADSGLCKKTTAMDLGYALLIRMDDKINIFAQKITPEALIARLASRLKVEGKNVIQDCTSMVFAPELSVFLGKEAYNSGLISILTDLYQGRDFWDYETMKHGPQVLRNTLINFQGATTPAWISKGIPMDAVGGGFTARIVFVYSNKPRPRIAFPILDNTKRDVLVHDLNCIHSLNGEFQWGKGAQDWYKEWYESKRPPEPVLALATYRSRRHDLACKVAMLLSLSEGDSLKIELKHLKLALAYLSEVEQDMPKAMEAMEETTTGTITHRVFAYIKRMTIVDRATLMRHFSHTLSSSEMNDILNTLREAQVIEVDTAPADGKSGRGKKEKTIYRVRED